MSGSSRLILALLVASGPQGMSFSDIAAVLWGPDTYEVWLPSLARWIAQLQQRLPLGWAILEDVGVEDPIISIRPAPDGWVDAWRLAKIVPEELYDADDFEWMLGGKPYGELAELRSLAPSARMLRDLQLLVLKQVEADQALETDDDLTGRVEA